MGGTSKHITLRIPEDIVAQVSTLAGIENRTRSQMIVLLLRRGIDGRANVRPDGETETGSERRRGVDGIALPILRPPEEPAKRLHKVHPVWNELASGGGTEQRSEDRAVQQGALPKWSPVSPCQHGYANSFACRRARGGC